MLLLTSIIEHKMYGWDTISLVRRLPFCSGLERVVADPCVQISLWPSPHGGFFVADAHAIKVSRHHGDFWLN